MKRQLLIVAAILALAAAGCKDKPQEEAPSAAGPQVTSPAPTAQSSPTAAPPSQPTAVGHKGRVVATLNGGTYTFIQIEENGRKIWLGVRQTKINVGDEIEYPESPFVEKFKSKTLKRTFDKVYFVEKFKVNGK